MTERRVWLLDASIYIFRAWFSMPDRWHSPDGMPLNAVYGYGAFLLELIRQTHPARYLGAAFDESLGTCFRNDIFAGYKASRELPDEALAFQLRACRDITELAGIPCYSGERYEADDYLASLANRAAAEQLPLTVVTRDKDLGQLLRAEADRWWDFSAGVTLDYAGFADRFGVQPGQFADYLALVGDSIDDIPGVPGVGPKTAAGLLQALGSLEGIAADFDAVAGLALRGASKLALKLKTHWPQVEVSRRLAQLESGIPGIEALPEFEFRASTATAVADYLESLGLIGPLAGRWREAAADLVTS